MRARLLTSVAAIAMLVPATAGAADNSFAGTCDPIEGSAKFDTPLTFTAADNQYHFTGTGTCTGTLNGASVADAPVDAAVDGPFNGSCTGSESTAPGPGHLKFTQGTPAKDDDVTITFTMTFTGMGSEVDFTLKGDKSGTATGHASFLTTRTPPDVLVKCAAGGNSELPFDADATTDSALTSPSGASPGSGPEPQPTPSGGGGAPPPGNQPSNAPAPAISIPAQQLASVLKHGLRVACTGAAGSTFKLKATISRKLAKRLKLHSRTIGAGTTTLGDQGSGEAVIRLSAKARRALARARGKVAVKVAGTAQQEGGARRVGARTVLRR